MLPHEILVEVGLLIELFGKALTLEVDNPRGKLIMGDGLAGGIFLDDFLNSFLLELFREIIIKLRLIAEQLAQVALRLLHILLLHSLLLL